MTWTAAAVIVVSSFDIFCMMLIWVSPRHVRRVKAAVVITGILYIFCLLMAITQPR